MSTASHGMIAVDKMGAKILFLDPHTFETQKVLDGFQRTVHELLLVPETGLAYVPIYGDGSPRPQPQSWPYALHHRSRQAARTSAISICVPTSRRTRSSSDPTA